jgi:hypothetical protein
MSNTSTVTPYDSRAMSAAVGVGLGLAAVCVVGVAAGAIAVARWLAEETPEDRAAMDRIKGEHRRERLRSRTSAIVHTSGPQELPRLNTVALHLRDAESLLRSAEKLGYRREPLVQPSSPLAEQPLVLLYGTAGERLAIERNAQGRLVVHTAGDQSRVQGLVRQHTLDRAVEHLAGKGMAVQTATLANGEVQILARERDASRRGGAATIKTQVRTDGTAWVDVDCVRGNRCENVVSELAHAIGGEVSSMAKKDAYFQLPGEPTKTRVHV